jgi:hypothetical protein
MIIVMQVIRGKSINIKVLSQEQKRRQRQRSNTWISLNLGPAAGLCQALNIVQQLPKIEALADVSPGLAAAS